VEFIKFLSDMGTDSKMMGSPTDVQQWFLGRDDSGSADVDPCHYFGQEGSGSTEPLVDAGLEQESMPFDSIYSQQERGQSLAILEPGYETVGPHQLMLSGSIYPEMDISGGSSAAVCTPFFPGSVQEWSYKRESGFQAIGSVTHVPFPEDFSSFNGSPFAEDSILNPIVPVAQPSVSHVMDE